MIVVSSGGRSAGLLGTFLLLALGGPVDQETHSRWDLFGQAVNGPLRGAQLRALPAVDHFWFSWAAFFPDTEIYRS